MAQRNNKAKVQVQAEQRDERRTRRIEAQRDVVNTLPAILEASARVIDSVAAAHKAHVEGCGARYPEVVLAEHASGVSFLNRLLSIAEESGMVEAAAGAFKAACAASEADSREAVRSADCIKYEDVTCRPWTRCEPEPKPEPKPEPAPEPKPAPAPEPEPAPEPAPRAAKRGKRAPRNDKLAGQILTLQAQISELRAQIDEMRS